MASIQNKFSKMSSRSFTQEIRLLGTTFML